MYKLTELTAQRKQHLLLYGLLLLWCSLTVLYGAQLAADGLSIRQWQWANIAWLLLPVPLVWLQAQAGLPGWLQAPLRLRLWWPLLIGIGFGLLDVWIVGFVLRSEPYTSLPPFLQPFPYSIFLYGSGAIEIELFYRLVPLTIFMLLGALAARGRYASWFFWAGAVLIALREPLEQWPDGATWFVAYAFVSGFGMNFLQAIFFRRAGFLASLTLRMGHYLCWHILFGIWVQYVMLAA